VPWIYQDVRFQDHKTGEHPECPERLKSIQERLEQSDVLKGFQRRPIVGATWEQMRAVHGEEHLQSLAEWGKRGGGRIEADTVMSRDSFEVAKLAAGTAIDAVDQVMRSKGERAMCLIRPPGHHALVDQAMGFCLMNNVAIAAAWGLNHHRLDRILIVDWDVHHGNGTQDIFYESGRVFFFSAHRFPFYPGTGDEDETGRGGGLGATFNLPLAYGISRKEYLTRFESMLGDAARKCKPQLILLSAGFDAHRLDPIGSLGLETEDFGTLTRMVLDVAKSYCEGRMVSLLEGGDHLGALAESVEVHLKGIAG